MLQNYSQFSRDIIWRAGLAGGTALFELRFVLKLSHF